MDHISSKLRSNFEPVITEDAAVQPVCGDIVPTITIYNQNYHAPYIPVDKLPDGYEHIGDLPKEAANNTSLEGCKMYAIKE